MIDLKTYNELKRQVDTLQSKADKSQGALDHLMSRLKKEFDVDSLEEAKVLVRKLRRRADKAEQEFKGAVEQFEEEWKDVLDHF